MQAIRKQDAFLFGIFLFLAIGVTPVHAYLDPGTGSFILQMILGGVAGAALLLRVYWQKFLALFGSRSASDSEQAKGAGETSGE
ncbi:MAG: hypothetical protein NXI24_01785 [bacterium]|nr:hypothetical protein [bacterium]